MMLVFIILFSIITSVRATDVGEGHMKPLGFQRKSEGHVEVTKDILHSKEFYYKHIKGNTPVMFKDAAQNMPAFWEWNDTLMKRKFGHLTVDVAVGQKQDKSITPDQKYLFKDFLKKYQSNDTDIIMAHRLRKEMLDDIRLLPCLLCGGFLNVLQDALMWFSAGNVKTGLHQNGYDNILCVLSGSQQLFLVDHNYSEHIRVNVTKGKHLSSSVDIDAVDLHKYPGLSKAAWWEANMTAGDCLFIPYNWFRQVNSYPYKKRNMAISTWFYRLNRFNITDCESDEHVNLLNIFATFHGIDLDEKNLEAARFLLLLAFGKNKEIDRKVLFKYIASYTDEYKHLRKTNWKDFRNIVDKDKDDIITIDDIMHLTKGEMQFLSVGFPGLLRKVQEDIKLKTNFRDEL